MRILSFLFALLWATNACAQQGMVLPPDLSSYVKSSDLGTTVSGAVAAANASLVSSIPTPCALVPTPDTLNGSVGSGNCFIQASSARPTVVQAVNLTTDSSGNWTVTWAKAFTSNNPIVNPIAVNSGTLPVVCNVVTRSSTSASGRCWQANTVTLGGTLTAIVGLIINVFQNGAAGQSLMVIAREPTQ